jgi:hypothetical protein
VLLRKSKVGKLSNLKRRSFETLIKDEFFWTRLAEAEFVLRPTSEIVGKLESDFCCLSDIYKCFLGLINGYKDFPEILELVVDRCAFVHTESMAFAYFLDPKTKAGEGFIGNDLYDSDVCLKEFIMKNQFSQSVQQIEAKLELFVQSMKFMTDRELDYVTQKSALTYWLTVGATKFPILYKVAEIVFTIPTSQAASERVGVFATLC